MLVAVERNGPVRAVPVASDKIPELFPQVKRFVDKDSYLITDQNRAYRFIGKQFAAHEWVNNSHKEYLRAIFITIPPNPLPLFRNAPNKESFII